MVTINGVTPELTERVRRALPLGAGFDSGCWAAHPCTKGVRFKSGYHHMNQHGYYDGWVSVVVYLRTVQTGERAADQWQGWEGMQGPRPVLWDKHPWDIECIVTFQWSDADTRRVLSQGDGTREYIAETIHEAVNPLLPSHDGQSIGSRTFPGIKVVGYHRPPRPDEYWVKG